MKKLFILLAYIFLIKSVFAQVIQSSIIDSVLSRVSVESISRMNKELSGDTIALIGGIPRVITSRYWSSQGNILAAQYIFEKFQSYGLTPKYMTNNATNIHVYAEKTGIKYPNKKYIIGAHYDDIVYGSPDTLYGADDNASGVCAVLEAARLIANMNLDYTVIFVAFDEEEDGNNGPNRGSVAFADSLYFCGDSVLGVLNADMIGYEGHTNFTGNILIDTNSFGLYNDITGCSQIYNLGISFIPLFNANLSDHQSFIDRGYKALTLIEDYKFGFNPYYHSLYDRFSRFNVQYFYRMVKLSISALLTWSLDKRVYMNHIPLNSSKDTTSRIATVYIKSPFKIGSNVNAPRLYFRTGNGSYSYVNAHSAAQDTFRYVIPGRSAGSVVSYYFALQDSAGTVTYTLPSGGSGVNPPGTTPPPNPFVYSIIGTLNLSSTTVPKQISTGWIKDTIFIQQSGIVLDINALVNLNHANDGDLLLRLQRVTENSHLSQFNGIGGQNFSNTIFDDSATISITQGIPPYSGRFKPHTVLSIFNGKELSGKWILEIFDKGTANTGTLINWSLEILYTSTISVKQISGSVPENFLLSQNYPNPFNPVTKIKFDIPSNGKWKIENGAVQLNIYDITGRKVETLVNDNLRAGSYEVEWNAAKYSSGIYFYKLTAGDFSETKRMVLVK
jgi:subtilisin-like proprotein convertase family protein